MKYKKISISLPVDFLVTLDLACKGSYSTRSNYIREAAELKFVLEKYGESEALELLKHYRMDSHDRWARKLTWTEVQE